MPTKRPIITLLSDFGVQDSYVAQMKGVILSSCADVRLCDLSHDLPHADLEATSFFLAEAVPRFPEHSIHLAVVDPGVGTSRRAVLLELEVPAPDTERTKKMYFIGPDNGIFTGVVAISRATSAWALPNAERAATVGSTFDGRDLFAPCAARLAAGDKPSEIGSEIDVLQAPLVELDLPSSQILDGEVQGVVRKIDRFGNAMSSIPVPGDAQKGVELYMEKSGQSVPLVKNYQSIPPGEIAGIANSAGFIELAANCGSAAELGQIAVGDRLRLRDDKKR